MANATVWADLRALADKACTAFDLPRVARIEPALKRHRSKHDGLCYEAADGWVLEIRTHQYRRPTRAVTRASIMACLAHELAHLRCWRHGREHRDLTKRIALWLVEQGQPVRMNRLHRGSFPRKRKVTA